MEGEEHKIQRRVIAPAFSTSSVKAMAPIFFQKAEELRDRWLALIHTSSTSPTAVQKQQPTPSTNTAGQSVIDISHWVARATFDVIGLAGFDYHFHALQDESEDVYLAYRKMFNVQDKGPGLKAIVSLFFPIINTLFVRISHLILLLANLRGCLARRWIAYDERKSAHYQRGWQATRGEQESRDLGRESQRARDRRQRHSESPQYVTSNMSADTN